MVRHPVLIAAILLGLFGVAGTSLVAFTYQQTEQRILANERQALLNKLHAMVPAESVDNDMALDTLVVNNRELLGSENTTVYRGRYRDEPVAAVLTSVVPDGYSGPIRLLVAVRYDGSLGGVRVVSHKETPGLGDKIEEEKSDWIYTFDNKSLQNPKETAWKVKRDGGVFDQFTGATITPRSIVKTVKNTLLFVASQGNALYARPNAERTGDS